jgi:ribose transport system permease protein
MKKPKFQVARHTHELVLAAVILCFMVSTKGFLEGSNLVNLLAQSVPILLLALGQMAVMVTGGLDLTQGAAAGVFSVLLIFAANTFGAAVALPAVFVGSIILGLFNSLAVIWLRNAFVATFAMMYVLVGGIIYMTEGTPISVMPVRLRYVLECVGGKVWWHLPVSFWVSLVPAALLFWILRRTRPGLNLYAWGSNPEAARLQGVREFSTLWLAYSLSALGSALAGCVLSARVLQGNPQMGEGLLFESIAACVIGGVALTGGVGGVWAAMRGVALLMVIQNGLYLLNLNSHVRDICVGGLIALSVLITRSLFKK